MASLRALNTISRRHGITSSLFLSPFNTSMSRPNSTKVPHASASGGIWISAFERVMQDLYGDQWKAKLTRHGRRYVGGKEKRREKIALEAKRVRDDYDPAVWHERVQKLKARILQEGKDDRVKPEAVAEAQKAHS